MDNIAGIPYEKYKAYHECGHAIVSYLFGHEFVGKISIVSDENTGGRIQYKFRNGDYAEHKTTLFRNIWISLAGKAVCENLTEHNDDRWSRLDYRDAMGYAQELLFHYWLEEGDELHESEIIAYIEKENNKIKEILKDPDLWDVIGILAKELEDRKEISGNEFREIISNSGINLDHYFKTFYFQEPNFQF